MTKCTALINNVIAPCMFKDLISDIGDAQYSLVIDESTDITSVKQLCVVIRYFSITFWGWLTWMVKQQRLLLPL